MPNQDDSTVPPASNGSDDQTILQPKKNTSQGNNAGNTDEHTLDYTQQPQSPQSDTFSTLPSGNDGQESNRGSAPKSIQYFGDYEVIHEIARGGMGVVFKARQKKLNRLVAIKMILSGELASDEAVSRFFAEAQAAATLDHPGIVPVYEIGQHDGQHYFSMGYVDGKSLADRVAKGPLPPKEAAEITRKIAEAIAYAHEKGVIHRDLKPANVLMDANGEPKVTDFGLARIQNQNSGMTRTGTVMGTPSYMPPEQAAGKTAEVGPLSDVYSLGALLYCLLTGRPPFQAATPLDTLMQVIEKEPVSVQTLNAGVPKDLGTICQMCLQKESSNRYASAQAFADDLGRWIRGEPIQARAVSSSERALRWVKRNKLVSGLVAGTLAAILIGAGASLWFGIQAKISEHRAKVSEGIALASANEATAAKAMAEASADKALASADESRHSLYAAHMGLVQRNWEAKKMAPFMDVLQRYGPKSPVSSAALRGFEWYYYSRMANSSYETLWNTLSVAYSSDGAHLALARADGSIILGDVSTGLKTMTLQGQPKWADKLIFSSDGTRLAAAGSVFSGDNTIKVWDLLTGQECATLSGQQNGIACIAFSPDGTRLASGANDSSIKLWTVATGQEIVTLQGHSGEVENVVFSPDGTRLASRGLDKTINLWNVTTGLKTKTLQGHDVPVITVAFSPDGTLLASGDGDSTVKLWNGLTGEEIVTLRGSRGSIESLAFSPDGTRLASCNYSSIKLWDTTNWEEKATLNGGSVVSFSPDGGQLASGDSDGMIQLWDVSSGRIINSLQGHLARVSKLVFSPDGARLVSWSDDKTVKLWDASPDPELLTDQQSKYYSSMAYSLDGTQMALGGHDGIVSVWDVSTRQQTARLRGPDCSVKGITFSPDGKRLAWGTPLNTIELWDVSTGQKTATLQGHSNWVSRVAFSPDGTQLASGSIDETIKLWDLSTGQEKATLQGHRSWVLSLDFSADGKLLASGSLTDIKLWDVATGKETATLIPGYGNGHQVLSLDFSSDGRWLASGHDYGGIKLWNMSTSQQEANLQGHSSSVTSVAFNPDGTRLASKSTDGTVKLFDFSIKEEVMSFVYTPSELDCKLWFSSDGMRLGGSHRDNIKIWDARPWTPETRLEQQALGLVRCMLPKYDSEESLQIAIRENKLFTEDVRKRALEYSSLFWKSKTLLQAEPQPQ
jgi:WD40 repeat protein/tRNA A-37 threonylcarbamoyl transferase component Bud32